MKVPFMTAPTKDERFIQMCARQKRHFRNWLHALGLESLLNEPDLPYIPDLFPSEERLDEVVAIIRERMRERTRDEWMDIFSRDDIGGDPFLSAPEYLEHPQCLENDRSKIVVDPVGRPHASDRPVGAALRHARGHRCTGTRVGCRHGRGVGLRAACRDARCRCAGAPSARRRDGARVRLLLRDTVLVDAAQRSGRARVQGRAERG